MPLRTISLSDIRVAPAATEADWAAAEELVFESLDWLSDGLRLDSDTVRRSAARELADLSEFYKFPRGIVLLGWVSGRPSGLTAIRMLDSGTAELSRAWITPDAEGNGLAQVLLARSIDASRALGASRIVFEADPKLMPNVVQMCRESGFREGAPFSRRREAVPTLVTMEKRVA